MFGYVRLHKPTITMGEYEQYRGIYCTLCRRLGKRYGLFARWTLNYDMTFLAVLSLALEPESPAFCRGRCSFNPTKRCLRCQRTDEIDFAADLTVLFSYYKLKDTVRDEGFLRRVAARVALVPAAIDRRRAARRRPGEDSRIAAMMTAQAALERENTTSIDAAAEPFAGLLGELAARIAHDDRERRILERFGYCLGRWVYLTDAVDDLERDLRRGRFNPYARAWGLTPADDLAAARERAVPLLNACLAECLAAYNLLEPIRFDGILRNILEQGMPVAGRRAVFGKEMSDESRSV